MPRVGRPCHERHPTARAFRLRAAKLGRACSNPIPIRCRLRPLRRADPPGSAGEQRGVRTRTHRAQQTARCAKGTPGGRVSIAPTADAAPRGRDENALTFQKTGEALRTPE